MATYPSAQNGNTTSVASSAAAVTLLPANNLRQGATISNNSTAILYVLLGNGTVSASNFTVAMAGNANGVAYYEAPYGFLGTITGLWASANGAALVTELT